MTESPGGATVRSVRVRMEADIASYVRDMRTAGRETDASFGSLERRLGSTNKALGDTDRQLNTVSRSERTVATSTDHLGQSLGRTNKQLDTFSGRTGLILKALALVGPAIVPLTAGLVPALSAIAVGGGAAAAGIGVTVLAVSGLGDALKALDTYQLDRTPENLAKVREEFQRIGPAGEDFVRFLDSIEPELKSLQMTAREGALPGFEEGIKELLTELPMVRSLIGDIASTVGDLGADAGGSLAGEDFEAFFDYLRTDAAPTLDALSRIVGNPVLPAITGTNPAFAAASGGGDKVAPNDRTHLHVRNAGGGSITVTVVVPGNTRFGQAQPDVAIAIAAGAERLIGPLPAELAGTDGLVDITYSGVTSVTVAAITS